GIKRPHDVIGRVNATGLLVPGLRRIGPRVYQTVVAYRRAENNRVDAARAHACAVAQMPGRTEQAALARIATHHGDASVVWIERRVAGGWACAAVCRALADVEF